MKRGSSVALITPFTSTGEIDTANLRTLLQYHVAAGTDNLCILGTTAEAAVMDMKEREMVLKIAVEEVKGKMPILVGTGTIDPNAVKAMTQQAIDLGCDASLLVSPYYVKPPQRGLIKHVLQMADMALPVIVYNVPGRTGVDFLDESVAICSQHDNVIGLKDATGNLKRVTNMRRLVGDDFLLYSGDDATSLEFCKLGGDGCISVTANVAAKAMADCMRAGLDGRLEEADALNAPLALLHDALFLESNPICCKWSAQQMGLIKTAYCRAPLDEMDPKFEQELTAALKAAGLL
jgi:4-hydroxy-tetrahydrodipicolinate synthase